jgi:dephospho-CoA kinase
VHVFGLTGGIASGKSAVLSVFRAEGVATVDADEMARAVVKPGSDGLAAIVDAFGPDVLQPDGALDRKKVAALVFGDDARRRTLNGIIHPRVGLATQARFTELGAQGFALGCYDAALLVETGLAAMFRPLVVVASPRPLQHARLLARDHLSPAEADARLDSQAPLEAKLAAADVVIWNDADLPTLETRAREALGRVKQLVAAAG